MPERRAAPAVPRWWLALALAGLGVVTGILAMRVDVGGRIAAVLVLVVFLLVVQGVRRSRDLGRTRARYQALVEQLPGAVYVAEFEAAGSWLYVSPQVERILGYPAEDWIRDATLFDRIIQPEDEAAYRAAEARSRETGGSLSVEYRMRAKDGRVVWIRDDAMLVRDAVGRPLFHQGVLFDITERKRIEMQLQTLQAERARLLDRTVQATEQERSVIAMELHDGPIQHLSAVALKLETLGLALRRPQASEDLRSRVRPIQERLTEEIDALRRIMRELRPPALDERGLEAALMDHLNAIQTSTSVACTVRSTLEGRLDSTQETVLFRVAQEALTNVVRHAGARHAWVTLTQVPGSVTLEIRDDGDGFDTSEMPRLANDGHFGLIAMRERVEMAGGTWDIESSRDGGTRITVSLPRAEVRARAG
jgi:two-component system, NarL family, sensor histidine kinase UhpB